MSRYERPDFELFYIMETELHLSQCELAERLDISVGHADCRPRVLLAKGSAGITNTRRERSKADHAYALTSKSLAGRGGLRQGSSSSQSMPTTNTSRSS